MTTEPLPEVRLTMEAKQQQLVDAAISAFKSNIDKSMVCAGIPQALHTDVKSAYLLAYRLGLETGILIGQAL